MSKRLNELASDQTLQSTNLLTVFTNQAGLKREGDGAVKDFQLKLDAIVSKLAIEPVGSLVVLVALDKDIYRKPSIGMWTFLTDTLLRDCRVRREESFFVGDAAGRLAGWRPGARADFAATDRKWALNLNLPFFTPEEYFLGCQPATDFDLAFPFHPKTLVDSASSPLSDPKEWGPRHQPTAIEMVMVVGPPGSGKTTLYQRHFNCYVHVNMDTLKTRQRCYSTVESALRTHQSVFIDNTNPSIETRAPFINLARKHSIPIRCIRMQVDQWTCLHLDTFRSITRAVDPLPRVAFTSFWSKYQQPSLSEGFESIVSVPFVPQFQSKEEEDLFCQYLI